MIGNRIKELYKALKLTQAQFADIVGVSHSAISHIQSGKNKPSKRLLIAIYAKFPQTNTVWLETGKGEMFVEKEIAGVKESSPGYNACYADPVFKEICRLYHDVPGDLKQEILEYIQFKQSLKQGKPVSGAKRGKRSA